MNRPSTEATIKTVITIERVDGECMVSYTDTAPNGEVHVWRNYATNETPDEIRAYIAATYPNLKAEIVQS